MVTAKEKDISGDNDNESYVSDTWKSRNVCNTQGTSAKAGTTEQRNSNSMQLQGKDKKRLETPKSSETQENQGH
jgi:hypothetical protein